MTRLRYIARPTALLCTLICLLASTVISGHAFDDEDTHPRMTGVAVDQSTLDNTLKGDLRMAAGTATLLARPSDPPDTVRRWLQRGARLEDDPACRASHHFHNPLKPFLDAAVTDLPAPLRLYCTNRGFSPQWANAVWATGHVSPTSRGAVTGNPFDWHAARRRYFDGLTLPTAASREAALADAFETIGHVMHLVQDLGVPAHTRSDFQSHLELFPRNAPFLRWFGNRFENFVRENGQFVDDAIPTPVEFGDKSLIRLWDLDQYNGSNPSAGTDQGLAEYSNANFASLYTVFTEGFAPTDQYAFPYPRQSSTNLADLIQQQFTVVHVREAEDQVADLGLYLSKTGDGQLIEHFLRAGYLTRDIMDSTTPGLLRLTFTFDDRVHRDYAAALVPRAIGYSQALLDYFFRGKLDVDVVPDAVDPTLVRIEGKNASPERLDGGTLRLYADVAVTDPAGVTGFVRQPATAVGSDLTITADPNAPVQSAAFQAPAQAERFVAVYTGKLGEERPSTDPADNPGAVIGKVLGGLRVEQVFPDFDSGFWMLRSPTGVFPLPISLEDIVTLRWGDADNTLVGRTAFGRLFGEPNQIVSFEILRPEGSTDVPLQNGVVRLAERTRVSVPFGLALGTTVALTHGIQFEQKLVTFRHEESFVNSQRTENSLSHRDVETFTDSKVLSTSWNLSLDFDKFTASSTRPYTWRIPEVALRRDGTILALVQVTLTAPTDPNSFATFPTMKYASPVPGCQFPCEAPVLQPGNDVGVPYAFPQSFNAIGYLVDVTNGRVLHSTAPPVVSFAHTTRATRWNHTSPSFAATEFHLVTRTDTSTQPATVVTGYEYDSGNNQRGAFCAPSGGFVQFDAINANEGTTFLGAVRFRPEIAAKDAPPSFEPVVRQDRFCVGGDGTTTFGYDVTTDAPRRQLAVFHFETSTRPPGEPERLVFEIEEPHVTPPDVFARIVFWDPAAGLATMHRVSTRETANLVSVGRDAAWFHASTTSIYVPRDQGTAPTSIQIDFSPSLAFRILDDRRLYSADTLRFHALDPALRATALPAVLPGGGNRSGDFHAISLK